MFDHETAEKLRTMLGSIQESVFDDSEIPEAATERLITLVSTKGFRLVDDLEGVVR